MRILYDGEIYSGQAAGGINSYFASLIGRLPASFKPTVVVARDCGVSQPVHPRLRIRRISSTPPGNFSSRLKDRYLRAVIDSSRFDVAHPTYYQLVTRQDLSSYRCPLVLTVWDMIHELFADQMDPTGFVAQLKRKAIQAAEVIICISENTRKDLLERHPMADGKVRVTALAADIDISLSNGPEGVPSRPYYLYVGSRSFYKNFGGLSAALAKAVSARPEMALCVVGAPFNEAEQKLIADLKLTNHIEHYGYPTKEHLAKLYRQSIALVYPSLYEGFGIPPLEAMACGTAVIASNVASIPEVVGEAGLLFDPRSPDELTDRLLLLFDSPGERDRLVAKGRERARAFSWDKTAAETLQIYRSVTRRIVS
jgi:glycosyltransferase involved in cell wall biosynthesis